MRMPCGRRLWRSFQKPQRNNCSARRTTCQWAIVITRVECLPFDLKVEMRGKWGVCVFVCVCVCGGGIRPDHVAVCLNTKEADVCTVADICQSRSRGVFRAALPRPAPALMHFYCPHPLFLRPVLSSSTRHHYITVVLHRSAARLASSSLICPPA